MIGVGGKRVRQILMQKGQGPDVHTLIVIRQVNTGKHAFDEQALARPGISYDSYNVVKRA